MSHPKTTAGAASSATSADVDSALQTGRAFHQRGKLTEARGFYEEALKRDPRNFDALHLMGVVEIQLGRAKEGVRLIKRALEIDRRSEAALINIGTGCKDLGRYEEALSYYGRAIVVNPNSSTALNNRAAVRIELKTFEEALADLNRTIALEPDFAEAYFNRGTAFAGLSRREEAVADFVHALSLNPNSAPVHYNLANVLRDHGLIEQAAEHYAHAARINPDHAEAFHNLGATLAHLKRYPESLAAYDEALRHAPRTPFLEGEALTVRMQICDWSRYSADRSRLIDAVRAGEPAADPFGFLGLCDDPGLQMKAARSWAQAHGADRMPPRRIFKRAASSKIRLGYVSVDFYGHAVMALILGALERHNRDEFEVYGFSIGSGPKDAVYERAKRAFDHFVDLRAASNTEVAAEARRAQLDIAVDLSGYTQGCRPEVFFDRIAPVQVNYLGYPGTMAATAMDYIISDRVLTPDPAKSGLLEKVVRLPWTYQANDDSKPSPDRIATRKECELPEHGFVFCCFNNSWKITPDVFDSWVHILQRVDGSVLWLLRDNEVASENLKKEAQARGLDPARLIFAPRISPVDHLARHALVDLFLDTFPYNAHTTASDSLWVGVPVLTRPGASFASRVAQSVSAAAGLSELVASTSADYERLAVEWASKPEALRALSERLRAGRAKAPLFNTPQIAKHLEAAYKAMHARRLAGLRPDHIDITP